MSNKGNRGKWFEAAVVAMNTSYWVRRLARIEKNDSTWTVIGYNAKAKKAACVFPKAHEGVDYYGTIRGGLAIYFDAKETQLLRLDFSMLRPNQVRFLNEQSEVGAITGVLLHVVNLERVYWVPWKAIWDAMQVERTTKTGKTIRKGSLSAAELEAVAWPVPWYDGGLPDYLPTVLRKIGAVV